MTLHDDDDDEVENYKFRESEDDSPDVRDMEGNQREMARCPHCKKWILEDSPKCPYCKNWVLEERGGKKSRWFIATVLICIAIAIWWALFG